MKVKPKPLYIGCDNIINCSWKSSLGHSISDYLYGDG